MLRIDSNTIQAAGKSIPGQTDQWILIKLSDVPQWLLSKKRSRSQLNMQPGKCSSKNNHLNHEYKIHHIFRHVGKSLNTQLFITCYSYRAADYSTETGST